ncbi:hypothetical protein ACFL2V_21755 [Pseudomonadota bacterium]
MSVNIVISIDQDIHDPLTMGQTSVVSEIFRIATDIIKCDGKVIVQRQFGNSVPDILCQFDCVDDLEGWRDRLNEVQIKLGRDEIE